MWKSGGILAAGLALAVFSGGQAWAVGEDDTEPSPTVEQCKKGEIWDKQKQKCVVPKKSEIDDESIYEAGRDLAYAGRYEEAIDVLYLASNRDDKRILNFLGYASRKAGRLEVGIGYYRQAMEIDPEYALVREYYGEALLMKSDLEGALAQLDVIKRLCGSMECEEYEDLSEDIEAFKTARGG